jgi:hypothetical protein
MIPARQSPNDPAMIIIATGNDAITLTTQQEVVEGRCHLVVAGACGRVRERRVHRDEHEEDDADRLARRRLGRGRLQSWAIWSMQTVTARMSASSWPGAISMP